MTPGQPKNWDAYYDFMGEDPPYEEAQRVMGNIVRRYGLMSITFVTGRPEGRKEDPSLYREITTFWLKKHFDLVVNKPPGKHEPYKYPYSPQLFMRTIGDHRPSVLYKEEIVRGLFGPFIFLDDDVRNAEMYGRYGIYFKAPECFAIML